MTKDKAVSRSEFPSTVVNTAASVASSDGATALRAAHTPGPWRLDAQDRAYIRGADKSYVAARQSSNPADGPLIAAAPELLAVVRRVAESITEADGWANVTPDLIEAARAAVAKVGVESAS